MKDNSQNQKSAESCQGQSTGGEGMVSSEREICRERESE